MHTEIAIGELSRRTECNIETILYYERIGLLPPPRRPGGRFRRYDADDVARLHFIRRARKLGFTLDDARTEARNLATAHVAGIRSKIADLQAMERVLSEAICECEAGQQPGCPLIEVQSSGTRGFSSAYDRYRGDRNTFDLANLPGDCRPAYCGRTGLPRRWRGRHA